MNGHMQRSRRLGEVTLMILWLNCLVFLCKWLLKCACDACGIVSGFERFYGRMDAWMNEGKDVSELCEDARIE